MKKRTLPQRMLAIAMAAALITMVFAGCQSDPAPSTDAPADSAADSGAASEEGGQPAESSPGGSGETLEIAVQTNSFVTDYKDNYFTKVLEEELGIDLKFYDLPSDGTEVRTKLSLMISSRDSMPDIINIDNALTPETILDYGSKGAFLPLNDYLSDPAKSPNFHAVPDDDRAHMLRAITMADGNIYALPKYEMETWNLTPYRMYLNHAWLDTLGLEVPTTTAELKDVLIAFRDGDPNGNGVQDEIGVYGYAEGGYGEFTAMALMNSFVFYNGGTLNGGQNGGLALDDSGSTVIAPFTTDGWREGLAYMNDLYNERVLAASMFTDDQTQFRATLNNPDVNVVALTSAGSLGNWPDADFNENHAEMDIIAPLAGPSGIAYTPYNEYNPGLSYFITANCSNPDLAFALGDLMLNEEISMIARFGEPGVDWTRDPAELAKTSNALVEMGVYDALTSGYMTNIWAEPANKHWHNVNPRYSHVDNGNTVGNLYVPYNPELKTTMYNAFSYQYYFPSHPANILSVLLYTAEEAEAITEPMANITQYVKQSLAEFITGARDINSGWDSYLDELNSMGLQTWLDNAQSAYERMNA